jgi:threonine/homoserine/homoserine lactone efflux protein
MLAIILFGCGYAFAAAIQPGPLQAFLLNSVARHGWQRTLPAALAPLVSDAPIILLALLALNGLPPGWTNLLRGAGGFFLIYLAWSSFRQWRREDEISVEDRTAPRTLLQAAAVNLLNPAPYIAWSLVMGPALLDAWVLSPVNGIALLVSFYGTLVLATAGIILLFGTTTFLSPSRRRMLVLVSAALLAGLGIYQIWVSVAGR